MSLYLELLGSHWDDYILNQTSPSLRKWKFQKKKKKKKLWKVGIVHILCRYILWQMGIPSAGNDPSKRLAARLKVLSDLRNLNDCMIFWLNVLLLRSNLSNLFNLNKLSELIYNEIVRNRVILYIYIYIYFTKTTSNTKLFFIDLLWI